MTYSNSFAYVPKSLTGDNQDNFELVSTIVSRTFALLDRGICSEEDLPENIVQLVWSDYYFAQVMNGGHEQFIDNTIEEDLPAKFKAIRAAFAAMKAKDYLRIVDDFSRWMDGSQSLDVDADLDDYDEEQMVKEFMALEELDDRLAQAHEDNPLEDLQARWILSWPNLKVVDDEEMEKISAEALDLVEAKGRPATN